MTSTSTQDEKRAAQLREYHLTFGHRGQPVRLSFPAMAEDEFAVIAQHIELAQPGERMRVRTPAEEITQRTRAAWLAGVE